jgi:glutamate racemase
MKIGMFDSGVGGLTVLSALQRLMPEHDYIYFGDTANAPYGDRTPEEIRRLSEHAIRRLNPEGLDLLVVACNTSASTALTHLRNVFPGLPTFTLIAAGAEEAASRSRGKVGIIATRRTIESASFVRQLETIAPEMEVRGVATPELVPLIERGVTDRARYEPYFERYLAPLSQWGMDTLILGCTHYPLILTVIQSYIPSVTIVDPAVSLAVSLHRKLPPQTRPSATGTVRFMASGPEDMLHHYWNKLQSLRLSSYK